MGMPGWPDSAFCTASMASARMAFAMSLWVASGNARSCIRGVFSDKFFIFKHLVVWMTACGNARGNKDQTSRCPSSTNIGAGGSAQSAKEGLMLEISEAWNALPFKVSHETRRSL